MDKWNNLWLMMQFCIFIYGVISGQYIYCMLAAVLVIMMLLRKPSSINQNKCNHNHVVHTEEYDYCYICGKKLVKR